MKHYTHEPQGKRAVMTDDSAEFGGAELVLFIGPRIVVLERDETPGIPWPGCLDLPGGGRDGFETATTCVLRECREEIGLKLTEDQLVWQTRYGKGVFFAAHLGAGAELQIRFGNEGRGWQLMHPLSFAEHPKAIPHFARIVRQYLLESGTSG